MSEISALANALAGQVFFVMGYVDGDSLAQRIQEHGRPPFAETVAQLRDVALAVRLFANMTAGHIVVLALIGLIFTFQSWAVAGGPFIMAVLIMMLELFVALLQAYIFTLLSSVFIGLIREGAH